MPRMTRRSAISAALLNTAVHEATPAAEDDEPTLTKDQEFVIAAGMTKDEADCWKLIAEAAGAFFKLPELHAMDSQEVASAIHIVQNKLLARPTCRKYLELAKQSHNGDKQ
ncbi:MAG: hypothetical protein NXI04_25560 [Planctomycetaceae bacterium]|nr:hypothetical protein [Planctomycetaceae bacterium]